MNKPTTLALIVLPWLTACAVHSDRTHMPPPSPVVAAFSAGAVGRSPERWTPLIVHRAKRKTEYRLVADKRKAVLHARAENASSGLMQQVSIDPQAQPWLQWRWRIGSLIAGANNSEGQSEDSPVRIILGFEGDKAKLSFTDQIMFESARLFTPYELPYATLMYVWENQAPVGAVIDNPRTARIKMIVAASGPDGIGQWREFTRNVAEDFENAFGEKPGRLIAVGVLTDTDNTGETVEAWYGDIRLLRSRPR